MNRSAMSALSCKLLAATLLGLAAHPSLAADDADALPKGAAVTVLKAAQSCFVRYRRGVGDRAWPRDETAVRPERPGLKVAGNPGRCRRHRDRRADAGAAQPARRRHRRWCRRRWPALIASSSAVIGAVASGKGEALFSIIARSEFDLVGAGADPGHRAS